MTLSAEYHGDDQYHYCQQRKTSQDHYCAECESSSGHSILVIFRHDKLFSPNITLIFSALHTGSRKIHTVSTISTHGHSLPRLWIMSASSISASGTVPDSSTSHARPIGHPFTKASDTSTAMFCLPKVEKFEELINNTPSYISYFNKRFVFVKIINIFA